jgi:hypothetical protein
MTQRIVARRLPRLGLIAVLAVSLLGMVSGPAQAQEARQHIGWIDGAQFRVEVPADWNGTLVMYSHGYFPPGYDPGRVVLANRTETESWLLDHGYALAASNFTGIDGAVYEVALRNQTAVLDWFDANIGKPRRTVALGSSSGAELSVQLAERNPRRFDGVLALCGPFDITGAWDSMLDVNFALRTLLTPGIDLVHFTPESAAHSATELQNAVGAAVEDPRGRARLALAGAFGNVPSWIDASGPRPSGEAAIRQQAGWILGTHVFAFGPFSRLDLEGRAGGNPSSNTGVDYTAQLLRSGQFRQVIAAYREAGLDLRADLAALAHAPRISADPVARDWLARFAEPRGTTPTPILTAHNVADAAEPGHERWLAGQVGEAGIPDRLRQVYVNRPGHCSFTASEEIVALGALIDRLDHGRWPHLDPRSLNASAAPFAPEFQQAANLATFSDVPAAPAFAEFTPTRLMRPSR